MIRYNVFMITSIFTFCDWLPAVVARPGVGRTLVAAEPLTAGAIVLTDSPFALALSKRCRHEVLKPLALDSLLGFSWELTA